MSRSVNKVMLIGNCAGEPEVKITSNSNKMVNVSIATNDSRPDGKGGYMETTEWHRINFWGKLADVAQNYLHKGSKVYVEGRLTSYVYPDKNHPEISQRTYSIQADTLIMLGSRQDSNGGYNSNYNNNSNYGGSSWNNSQDSNMTGGGYNSFGGNNNMSSYGGPSSNQSQNFGSGFSQATGPMAPQGGAGGFNSGFNSFGNNQGANNNQGSGFNNNQNAGFNNQNSGFNSQNSGFNNPNSGFTNNQNNRNMNNGGGFNGGNSGGSDDVPF